MPNPNHDPATGQFSSGSGGGGGRRSGHHTSAKHGLTGRRPGAGTGGSDKYIASTDDLGALRDRLSGGSSSSAEKPMTSAEYNAHLRKTAPRSDTYMAEVAKARKTPGGGKGKVWSSRRGEWTDPNRMSFPVVNANLPKSEFDAAVRDAMKSKGK